MGAVLPFTVVALQDRAAHDQWQQEQDIIARGINKGLTRVGELSETHLVKHSTVVYHNATKEASGLSSFKVGQCVRVGFQADNAVSCMGRIVTVGLAICDVHIEQGIHSFTGPFMTEHLYPVEDGEKQ